MFFEKFREALARLPAGLIRPGPGAPSHAISSLEGALGAGLPPAFVTFLESFDGADLFHEAVLLAGVGEGAPRRLRELNPDVVAREPGREIVFGEAAGGDRFAFRGDGAVLRIRGGSDERWFAGGEFSRWLDGVVAYHRVLYGSDGEFAPEAFEPDGSEVVPRVALRQAERALRLCPDSAEWNHERGVAFRRLDRLVDSRDAFALASTMDPENPWPLFDLGRVALELGPAGAREAGAAFERAALLDQGDAAGRLWIWAARAALLEASPERVAHCRRQGLAAAPALAEQLRRARDAAAEGGEPDEIAEAEALLAALEGAVPGGRVRLPVLTASQQRSPVTRGLSGEQAEPARPPPPKVPRRPPPAKPPRSVVPRVGRRR